jgi:hypothetical protein
MHALNMQATGCTTDRAGSLMHHHLFLIATKKSSLELVDTCTLVMPPNADDPDHVFRNLALLIRLHEWHECVCMDSNLPGPHFYSRTWFPLFISAKVKGQANKGRWYAARTTSPSVGSPDQCGVEPSRSARSHSSPGLRTFHIRA